MHAHGTAVARPRYATPLRALAFGRRVRKHKCWFCFSLTHACTRLCVYSSLVSSNTCTHRYAASLPLFEEMCTHVRALNALAFSHDPSPTAAAAGAFCPYRLDRFSHFPSDWANCSAPPEADVAAVAAAWQLALPPLPPGANVSERLGKGLGYPQAAPAGVTAGAGGAGAGAGAGGARALGQVGQGRRRAGSMRRRRGRRRALLGVKGVDGEEEQDVQQAAAEEQEAEGVMWGERSELLM